MIPEKYAHTYLPVKYFLSSYRAYSDASTAIEMLSKDIASESLLLSDWKIHWVAACTLLRTSIDLFKLDAKLCVNAPLAKAFKEEWADISKDKAKHDIYWHFLREERNNILHEYRWSAYEQFLVPDGLTEQPRPVTLWLTGDSYTKNIAMKSGMYAGKNALQVVELSKEWVKSRIFAAIGRAGLDPDEERNIVTFTKRPQVGPSMLSTQSAPD